MKYKTIGRAGLIAAAALALLGGVYAYLTSRDAAVNKISTAKDRIEIEETFDPPTSMKSGMNEYTKSVRIKNTGNVPCYIRVYVEFTKDVVAKISGLRSKSSEDSGYYTADKNGLSDDITIKDTSGAVVTTIDQDSYTNHLPDNWVYLPDTGNNADTTEDALGGWFYYTEPVEAGESTSALFDQVLTYFESVSDVTAYDIIVYSESVQVRDNTGAEVTEAQNGTSTIPAWKNAWTKFLDRRTVSSS